MKLHTTTENKLFDENYRKKIIIDYNRLKQLMGEPGSSKRAALKMVELLLKNGADAEQKFKDKKVAEFRKRALELSSEKQIKQG